VLSLRFIGLRYFFPRLCNNTQQVWWAIRHFILNFWLCIFPKIMNISSQHLPNLWFKFTPECQNLSRVSKRYSINGAILTWPFRTSGTLMVLYLNDALVFKLFSAPGRAVVGVFRAQSASNHQRMTLRHSTAALTHGIF